MSDAIATPAKPAVEYRFIPLANIRASKTNPRQRFDKAKLDELTDSVKLHGVLEPVLVRLAPGKPVAADQYEIIAGERRFRAATAAQVLTIPCSVHAMSDEQVCEVQVIENEQRDDLHPLEAAKGYYDLIHTFKHTMVDVAAKVGKSQTYLVQRLKLLELEKSVQQMFLDDKITLSIAQLIARIPIKDLHKQAAKEITTIHGGMTTADARDHIMRQYMLDLKNAAFDPADPTLVEVAGACGACPKRTGNQAALFADITKGDLCTDPVCFQSKCAAHTGHVIYAARKSGQPILEGKAAKAVMPHSGNSYLQGGYVALHKETYINGAGHVKPTKVLPKDYRPILLIDPHKPGRVIELAKEADIQKAINARTPNSKPTSTGPSLEERKRNFEAKNESLIKQRVFTALHTAVAKPLSLEALRIIVGHFAVEQAHYEARRHVFPLWLPEKDKEKASGYQSTAPMEKLLENLDAIGLQQLLVDSAAAPSLGSYSKGELLFELAKELGVDVAAHKAAVKSERAARAPKAPKAEKKPAKPKAKAKAKPDGRLAVPGKKKAKAK